MQYCFLQSLWLCCRSRWITEYPQSWNLCSPTALLEIRWCTTFPCSWLQSRWQSLCQGSVLLNHLAFKETLQKISQTLQNHLSAWHSIVHSLSSRVHTLCPSSLLCVHVLCPSSLPCVHVLCPSSLLCIHAWTRHIQHLLQENTASPRSSHNWQETQIWNFLDSGF